MALNNVELWNYGIDIWQDRHYRQHSYELHEYTFDSTDWLIHLLQTRARCYEAKYFIKYLAEPVGEIVELIAILDSKKAKRRILGLPIVPDVPQSELERFRAILKRDLTLRNNNWKDVDYEKTA